MKSKNKTARGIIIAAAAVILAAAAVVGGILWAQPGPPEVSQGDVITFGDYNWLVLEVEDDRALILTEDIIDMCDYNEGSEHTNWETCSLRRYLNGEFYRSFSEAERARIIETELENPDNPIYGSPGCANTMDNIFLLTVDDVRKFFSSHNDGVAKWQGEPDWWWLRTPGRDLSYSSVVSKIGVPLYGDHEDPEIRGLRPAMYITLD